MKMPEPRASLGVTFPKGYKAAGIAAAVKYPNRRDFAIILSEPSATAAGVFTTNAVAAAPVRFDREVVKRGKISAIAINTGFANACTGVTGEENAAKTAKLVAKALNLPGDEIAVCSTGVIGVNLPMDRIEKAIELAVPELDDSAEAADNAAHAIMTTDTVPKQASIAITVGDKEVRIGGMSKGAGMIEPYMATMLAFITSDAEVAHDDLQALVADAANSSFNRIVIDNDRSTNDSLFLLANGTSGVKLAPGLPGWDDFCDAVKAVCLCLAKQHVMDGEGVSKFVTLNITGAKSASDAQIVARSIARSMLVKTSWYGTDPNWGRVICAVGYSGVEVEESRITISYDGIPAFNKGEVATSKTLATLKEAMQKRSFTVDIDLGMGNDSCTIYTSDLTHEYVNINADYTT